MNTLYIEPGRRSERRNPKPHRLPGWHGALQACAAADHIYKRIAGVHGRGPKAMATAVELAGELMARFKDAFPPVRRDVDVYLVSSRERANWLLEHLVKAAVGPDHELVESLRDELSAWPVDMAAAAAFSEAKYFAARQRTLH